MKISTAANLVAFSCYVSSISVAADDQQQRQACTSDADCTGGATVEDGPGAYCSMVDNTCLAAGDCTALEDCTENLSNIFAVPMCLGTMYCMEDADASSPGRCIYKFTRSEYSTKQHIFVSNTTFQNTMKISIAGAIVAFSYATVYADAQQQRQACTSDADCAGDATVEDGPGDYCSMVDNTCMAAGDCTGLADCTENLSNIFAVPMCLGTMYCMEDAASSSQGRCVNICLGTPSTCDALDACVEAGLLEGECCPTTDGTFLACCFADPDNNGTEEEDPVATDPDDNSPAEDDSLMNEMMMGDADAVVPGTLPEADPTEGGNNPGSPVADDSPADADDSIPGTMPADPDESGENPDSPVVEDDFPADVDLLVPPGTIIESGSITMIAIRCLADSDCNTSQDNSDYYCAAGTCLPQGGCLLDTDCMNPSNYGIKDTKCVGYLFCDT
eukprot:CAMPEP_0170949974 /NCGR_PEP_ID=MMETSP0735-20130129/29630_1 /TAXON_ID=186038 /ORGANISM="Fragilariopsis kerguelensis, Strain L26-C5" /LENGTH=444 /DNA_ID=CAMNT_0011360211 /DNA_START=112 /DNA_END=1442 /DNA_ORIENTATION=-